MKAITALPENYKQIFSVNLQKDKKIALLINLIAFAIAIIMIVPMHLVLPIQTLFSMKEGLLNYALRFACLIIFSVLYIILHEAVHGIAMKICGTKKVRYGFTGLYAFAGSGDYYNKRCYIFISLAPVVLFGVLLALIQPFVPESWSWVIYFVQISNISGAAGDIYVTAKFSRMPKDILVQDSGIGMTVYSAQQ